MKKEYRIFAPNTLCLRCGADQKEERRLGSLGACSAHGGHYSRHLWNKEEVECEVQELGPITHLTEEQ